MQKVKNHQKIIIKKHKNMNKFLKFFTFLTIFSLISQLLGPWSFIITAQANGVDIVPNPPLTDSCGLDIALVIDSSGSIDDTELNQMKTAFHGFVNEFLPATPTQMSVTDFDFTATVLQGFTDNVTLINNAIDAPTIGGATNWGEALITAQSTFDPRIDHPNLIVFASDGNPTWPYGRPDVTDPGDINDAIVAANNVKSAGIRILTLGIGDELDIDNLKLISGPNVDIGINSDVITTDFNTLATDLAELANQLCGGTITVTKIIDSDGDLQTTGDQSPGVNWTFDIDGSPSNPAPVQTDGSGKTPAVDVQPGTYSVTETVESGYSLISAICTDATNNGSQSGDSINGIQVSNEDIVSCEFVNSPELTTITIIANKIVCDNESDLPNWGDGGPNILSTTAQDFVNSHPNCHFESGWNFEWASKAPVNTPNPGDNIIGGGAGVPWTTFGSTDINGQTSTSINLGNLSQVWVREILKSGYIPFSGDTDGTDGWNDESAELYCHNDVLNYDNYDFIDGLQAGQTYYCIAFNALEPPICGDGKVEGSEECDDGNNVDGDGCNANCQDEYCGDSVLQPGLGEYCDDGNNIDGDGCSSTCEVEPYCGDGNLDRGEECDDGNNIDGDGCSSTCELEEPSTVTACKWIDYDGEGYDKDEPMSGVTVSLQKCGDTVVINSCTNWVQVASGQTGEDGCYTFTDVDSTGLYRVELIENLPLYNLYSDNPVDEFFIREPMFINFFNHYTCGNGDLQEELGEECDDGNTVDGDGCSADCKIEYCGDGIINNIDEECDDGNNVDGDGCSASCESEREPRVLGAKIAKVLGAATGSSIAALFLLSFGATSTAYFVNLFRRKRKK